MARSTAHLAVALTATATIFMLGGCASAATQGSGPDSGNTFDYSAGPSADSPEAAALIETSGIIDDLSWCGTDPVTVGVADGFGTNGWSAISYAVVRSELAKCDNVTQIATAGQGDLTQSIADVNGLVAQGAEAIVVIPDFGEAQLPSLQSATAAGVKVVAWGADPGGQPGKDYTAYVDWDTVALGESWGKWIDTALDGEGKIVYLGGPAGNPVSANTLAGLVSAIADKPGIELLTGTTDFPVTNWNPSEAQSVMSSLLAKYPEIDGMVIDDGLLAESALRAYTSAGRALPVLATNEANLLACFWESNVSASPDFQIATTSNRNWVGRIAARIAVAAAQGIEWSEPSTFKLPLQEDSIAGPAPVCDASQPGDMGFSNKITPEVLEEFGNAN